MRMPYRTSTALPSTRRPGAIRALRTRGCACHGTHATLIDHRRGLQVCYTTLVGVSVYSKTITHALRMPYRTSTVLPSTRRPGAIRALRIRGCACHGTDAALIDHRRGLQVGFTTLTDIFVYFQNFKHSVHAPHHIQNTFLLLVCLNRSSANNAEGQRVLRGGCGKQRQGWRSAGVEPWMGSSTDEHRPRSTMRTTLNYSTLNINRCAQVFCGRAARAPRSSTAHTCNTQPQQRCPSLLRAGRPRSQLSNSSP